MHITSTDKQSPNRAGHGHVLTSRLVSVVPPDVTIKYSQRSPVNRHSEATVFFFYEDLWVTFYLRSCNTVHTSQPPR